MAYSSDAEMVKLRPNILSYGVAAWTAQHADATRIIDRALRLGWYRQACIEHSVDHRETEFDSAKLLNADTQLTALGTYKALELAYEFLMKGGPDDQYATYNRHYRERYEQELAAVLADGLDYDWDGDDALADEEQYERAMPRRLARM